MEHIFGQKIDWENVIKFNFKSHAFAPIQNIIAIHLS